jgi:hypothetical protein
MPPKLLAEIKPLDSVVSAEDASLYSDSANSHQLPKSRSPHPYHRRGKQSASTDGETELADGSGRQHQDSLTNSNQSASDESYAGHDERNRRKASSTPSDGGTEADDESLTFLKGLPAPPIRRRKGLRDSRGTGLDSVSSPPLTPSNLDESHGRFPTSWDGISNGQTELDKEEIERARVLAERIRRRRRGEIIRRVVEFCLMGSVGGLVLCGGNVLQTSKDWIRGKF